MTDLPLLNAIFVPHIFLTNFYRIWDYFLFVRLKFIFVKKLDYKKQSSSEVYNTLLIKIGLDIFLENSR